MGANASRFTFTKSECVSGPGAEHHTPRANASRCAPFFVVVVDVAPIGRCTTRRRSKGVARTFLVGLVREHLARALPSPLGLQFLLSFFLPPIGADGGAGRRPAAVVGHDSRPDAKEWPLPALPALPKGEQ